MRNQNYTLTPVRQWLC